MTQEKPKPNELEIERKEEIRVLANSILLNQLPRVAIRSNDPDQTKVFLTENLLDALNSAALGLGIESTYVRIVDGGKFSKIPGINAGLMRYAFGKYLSSNFKETSNAIILLEADYAKIDESKLGYGTFGNLIVENSEPNNVLKVFALEHHSKFLLIFGNNDYSSYRRNLPGTIRAIEMKTAFDFK